MRNLVLVALATTLTLVGCTTIPKVQEAQDIRYTILEGWAEDLEVFSIQGIRNGDMVEFRVDYRSGIARQFSFFNPPSGSVIEYVSKGIEVGKGVIVFSIPIEDLRKAKEITMGFGFVGGDRSFLVVNYPDLKRLIQ